MKINIFCLIFIINFGSLTAQKIYSTSQSYKADFNVFVVENEYQADLKVYKVSRAYEARKNTGLWFFSTTPYNSDKKIYFCENEYEADLKVFFVDYKYQAGWKNSAKKYLLY